MSSSNSNNHTNSGTTREARIIRAKQMSGAAMSMALKPSRGARDDIILAGGKPKDHNKENYIKLKELEKARKRAQLEKERPAPEPFRLKQFDDVPGKLYTRRSPSFGSEGTPSLASSAYSSRPSSAGSTSSITSSNKNFIHLNAQMARQPQLRYTRKFELRRQTPKGQLPKYLVDRKLEWAEKEKQRMMALEFEKIPRGMTLVPEDERQETLRLLADHEKKLIQELSQFSLVVESIRQKKRKVELETKLREVEDAIEMFSRPKVYISRDEDGGNVSFS
ncbi:calmodulin-binding-domain-containing protein [Chytridium lagenaria]|nr:calmodulin-binding-domain-containing protein [Chytridium lagenaria]